MGGRVDAAVHELARGRDGLVTRGEVQAFGGSDGLIGQRVASGRWTCVQAGVYLVGVAPPAWRAELLAATLAAGPGSVASHRAAVVLWGLEDISAAPLEITVPFTAEPLPLRVVQHRTRRPMTIAVIDGIPVTSVERTVLDAAGCFFPVRENSCLGPVFPHRTRVWGRPQRGARRRISS